MIALPGFIQWCENMSYQYISLAWSTSDSKGGAGYAGVMTLCKLRPIATSFDFVDSPSDEARVITHEFESFVHVSVYSPCTGYNSIKMDSRVKFDLALKNHLVVQQNNIGKPVICSGDLNINPRRQDWHEKAFASLIRIKEASGSIHHPGYSPSELEGYFLLLKVAKLSNAWEHLYPYSSEGMTWHPPSDPHGLQGWGQRLDHFLLGPEFLTGKWIYQLQSMINFRGEGSSDHNGLLLNLTRPCESPSIGILSTDETDNTDVLICNLDTKKSKTFKAAECPRITIEIFGKPTQVFIDTGAPFSIYNPPARQTIKDFYITSGTPTGSLTNCSFTGATGGRVTAEQNYIMSFQVGSHLLQGHFVVLTNNERNLPLFLLGQDLLMGPLEGVAVIPDVKHQVDKLSAYFGVEWTTRHPCESLIRLVDPPKMPPTVSSLVDDLDESLVEKYLPCVSNMDPEQLFDDTPLQEDAFIFGGTPTSDSELPDNGDESQYLPTEDNCFNIDGDEVGFHDCPLPVVQLGLVVQGMLSTLDVQTVEQP